MCVRFLNAQAALHEGVSRYASRSGSVSHRT